MDPCKGKWARGVHDNASSLYGALVCNLHPHSRTAANRWLSMRTRGDAMAHTTMLTELVNIRIVGKPEAVRVRVI
ncbi:MAG: hypothetical protein M3O09_17325 [Acidobacteriota bacterium]|nr:hypothetical protein [Acidobacteriota bacterium]